MDGDEEELSVASLGQFRTEFFDQDLLTCGVCRRVFPLSDILKFIRHKVKTCSSSRKQAGCSDRTNDGDDGLFEEEEEEVIDDDSSTPSPSPGSGGEDPQSPDRVKTQTPSIINSSQRHKFKLISSKQKQQHQHHQQQQQQQQEQQSYPHHRSFIGNHHQSLFNHQTTGSKASRNHRSLYGKKSVKEDTQNSGQSVTLSPFLTFMSCFHFFALLNTLFIMFLL